jgi:hypothetical protein
MIRHGDPTELAGHSLSSQTGQTADRVIGSQPLRSLETTARPRNSYATHNQSPQRALVDCSFGNGALLDA